MGKHNFCCAFGCNHTRSKNDTCNFYEFPVDEHWRKLWVNAVKRNVVTDDGKVHPWNPSDSSKLCSCHFLCPPNPSSRQKSNKHVLPTVFVFRKNPTPRSSTKSTSRELPPVLKRKRTDSDTVNKSTQHDHDYLSTIRTGRLAEAIDNLTSQHPEFSTFLHDYNTAIQKATAFDEHNQKVQILTLYNVKDDDNLFRYFTGFPTYSVFLALFNYLEDKVIDMKYDKGSKTYEYNFFSNRYISKPGKKRALTLQDEFFITLVRLKLGLPSKDFSKRFGISESSFSSIFRTWTTLLSIELTNLCELPSIESVVQTKASCFKDFNNIAIIIDCTELFSETPSSLTAHKQYHSNYKHHSTVKFMVGISPAGAVTYVSQMYGGRASDKFITNDSESLLSYLDPGTSIMADRGFTICDDLPAGVQLIIPPFKPKDKAQFSKDEVLRSKKISDQHSMIMII
ncbi:uncharacterized protein LOC126830983 [Patella vulgata]|uniref:uncharacterized protein LOC126830983 n=1 Tax=Patella vulgata TaxID=6465 RepID=UPI0024A8E728|nr:uncharacterized protein LOC126830983 [Patella vulgata]